jgi:hypothetical protein
MAQTDLSVIILSFNTVTLLQECLASLRAAAEGLSLQIIVVDNGSTDGSLAFLSDQPSDLQLIANAHNVGFAAANNQGMALAEADTLLLLNSDAFITSKALHAGIRTLWTHPAVGLVGVKLLNSDGSVQAESGRFGSLWDDVAASLGIDRLRRKHAQRTQAGPVDWVQGACMFVRRAALDTVGGLDSRYFMYSEEVDWCRRFWRQGWQVWYLPETPIVHVGGGSSQRNDLGRRAALYRSRILARRRWDGRLAGFLLWLAVIIGLAGRIVVRFGLRLLLRRPVGRQTPASDWQLLRQLSRDAPALWSA